MAVSPDGARIVSGYNDNTIRIRDTATGKETITLMSFTGTDSQLASASRGLVVETETATTSIDGEWLAITPDGYYTASARGDRYLNVRVNNTVTGIDAYSDTFYNPDVVQARLCGLPDPASKAKLSIQQVTPPPRVVINSPASGTTITSNSGGINLSVTITDQNKPLEDIRIMVNGIRIGSGELRGLSGAQGITVNEGGLTVTGNQKTVSFQVPLNLVEPGINRIEVMAFNGLAWGYSGDVRTVDLVWNPPTRQQIPLPNLWIMAVGVNHYDNAGTPALQRTGYRALGNLNFCANDAKELVASFKAQEGKRFARVNSLVIADGEATTPTAENIRRGFEFFKQAGQRDVVLLFMAGHGLSEGSSFYFLASDARIENGATVDPAHAISDEALRGVLNAPGRRLIFIDACQSGGMDIDRFMHSLRRTNAFMLSSSEGTKPSYEDARWNRHGVFSYSIIRGLGGLATPPQTANLGVKQLSGYVIKDVSDLTRNLGEPQRPVQYSWGFGDFDIAFTK
ncbi:hypothetical protein FACS189498_2410 [Spirochaetia bacterium]|nr:hypothetical protein FACS189498_2410 [Spirochaetia bacterium]